MIIMVIMMTNIDWLWCWRSSDNHKANQSNVRDWDKVFKKNPPPLTNLPSPIFYIDYPYPLSPSRIPLSPSCTLPLSNFICYSPPWWTNPPLHLLFYGSIVIAIITMQILGQKTGSSSKQQHNGLKFARHVVENIAEKKEQILMWKIQRMISNNP